MLITTSRKPSTKSRTLCKYLARFLNCNYVNRGKMSFEEIFGFHPDVPILLIGEYHGNPGSFEIFDPSGNYLLSIHMNVVYNKNFKFINREKVLPVVIGAGKFVKTFAKALSFEYSYRNSDNLHNERCILISENNIDFMDSGESLFSFRIKNYKLFDNGDLCESYG